MAFKWSTEDLFGSQVLKADHVNSAGESLQNFINQGIENSELAPASDFSDTSSLDVKVYAKEGWVGSDLIYRPEFYGSPSPRMMAVSGQTHFREVNNDWSKGVIFGPSTTGPGWSAIPNLSTTVKLRHSATVNIMASFYCFEFGGVAKSQARANEISGTGTSESYAEVLAGQSGIRTGPAGYFLKNELIGGSGSTRKEFGDSSSHGYETKSAGWVRLQVNNNRYRSTTRPIYTSHVDPRKPYEFPEQETDFYGEGLASTVTQNGYIFMPMIGRHLHHITAQVNLSEGVHNIGLCYKSATSTDQPVYLSSTRRMNFNDFDLFKGFPRSSAPKIPTVKNVFFLSRNLVVDCYYTDNEPL